MNHSPLPWYMSKPFRWKPHAAYGDCIEIGNAHEPSIAMIKAEGETRANAAFIVHAVNNHDKLREVLENLQIFIEEWAEDNGHSELVNKQAMIRARGMLAALKESEAR